MSPLRSRVSAWLSQRRAQILARGAASSSAWAASGAAVLFAADLLSPLPQLARLALLAASVIGALVVFWRSLLRPLSRLDEDEVFREAESRWPEAAPYLRSAWELEGGRHPGGVSLELARAHIQEAESRLRPLREPLFPIALGRRGWSSLVLAASLAAVLAPLGSAYPSVWSRLLAPWRDVPLESLLAIRPGEARVPWGEEVRIEAEWKEALFQAPGLEVRSGSGSWRRQAWDEETGRRFGFQLTGLAEPVEYRLRWKDAVSRVYKLTPVPYPHFASVHLRVVPPAYARQEPAELEGGQDLDVLPGSRVDVEGSPDRPVDEAWLVLATRPSPTRTRFQAGPGGTLKAGFMAESESAFSWELSAEGLRDPHPAQYQLRLLRDEAPTVELLSPAFAVEVGPREGLRVTYEAADDIGLSAVELRWAVLREGRAGPERVMPLETFPRRPKRFLGEARWDLSGFAPGTTVEFYLRALDGHPSGHSGTSARARLTIVDFEGQHQSVQSGVGRMAESLEGLRTREEKIADTLARSPAEAAAQSAGLEKEWSATAADMDRLARDMAEDPYSNPGLVLQYKGLAERLKKTAGEQVPSAMRRQREGDWKSAEAEHRALAAEAKRALDAMGQGQQVQVIQDMWSAADAMADAGSELGKAVEGLAADPRRASPEDKRRLDMELQRIQKQMEELSKAIEALPKPAPDSAAAKERRTYTVPLGSAQGLAAQLQKALAAGDYKSAAELAKRLSEELGKVRQALAEAQQGAASGLAGRESEELAELERLWAQAADAQAGLVTAAQGLVATALKSKVEAQKRMLRSLAQDEGVLEERIRALGPAELLPSLEAAREEFASGRVQTSEAGLKAAAARLEAWASAAPQDAARAELARAQREVLARLAAGPAPGVPEDSALETARGAALAQRQNAQRAKELADKASALAQRFIVAPDLPETVEAARAEMGPAAASLDAFDVDAALARASKALELLEKGKQDLQKGQQDRGQFESALSSPASGRAGARPAGGGPGRAGSATGFVPLPGAKDFQAPREVRQEIMRSLQERYPKSYEDVIRDYFKRLSQ